MSLVAYIYTSIQCTNLKQNPIYLPTNQQPSETEKWNKMKFMSMLGKKLQFFFYINLIRFLLCVTNIKRSQTFEWINCPKKQAKKGKQKINSFMYDRDWYCFRNLPIIKACYLSCNRVNKGDNLQGGHISLILIIIAIYS